jgi:diguanylate cyclase (GGDEF)-like protein
MPGLRTSSLPGRIGALVAGWCLAIGGALGQPAAAPDPWMADRDPVYVRVASTSPASAMAQTPDGFLWVGTQTSLTRWDGYRLKHYAAEPTRDGGLPDGFVNALLVDRQGRLWIGTNGGGLVRHDPVQDRFVAAAASDQPLSHKAVYAIESDARGRLLVATGRGVDLVDPAAGTVQRHAEFARSRGLPAVQAGSLLVDRDAGLWVGTRVGLFRGRVEGGAFVPVALPTHDAAAVVVNNLLQDSAGRVWVTTRSHGVFVVEVGRPPMPLKEFTGRADAVSRPGVHTVAEVAPGEIWIGTDGDGIVRVDTVSRRVDVVRHGREAATLPDDEVFALLRDRSGLVWIASDTALGFMSGARPGLATWWGGPGTSHGLADRNVPALLALADGRVWMATGSGGVDILDVARGSVVRLAPSPRPTPHALPPSRVLTLRALPGGDVLIGTQMGLYRADPNGKRITRLEIAGRPPSASTWVLEWHADRLWVGGLDGLWAVDPGGPQPLQVLARLGPETLREPRISALLSDGPHGLWVGTRAGLFRLDTTTMQVTPGVDTSDDPALERTEVPAMLKDRRGRLWIALFGGGVRVVEFDAAGKVAKSSRIATAQGLPQDSVDALALADNGDVWLSTDAGIAQVAHDTLLARAYGAADGIGPLQHWTGAATRTADGHLLFGASGGLTIVDPARVQPWDYPAPIAITELRLGDAPTAVAPGASGPSLAVPLSRRSVLVEFAALDFSAPERNRYEYRLRGAEQEWTATEPTRRLAAYTNLAPGDYVLQLRGSNRAGTWSSPLELPLHVPAAWHETAWFKGLLALLAVLLAIAFVQGRTLYLRRQRRALEALVAQRTADLEESQRQLEQMAYSDGLTGLANRRWFNEELQRQLAMQQRRGGGCGLLLIDLDHFKQINDTHGHDAGDAVLVAIAERLKEAVRETDTLARLGGDEFAALLPDLHTEESLRVVCERMLQALAEPLVWRGKVLQPGGSVGAARFPTDGRDGESLYKSADVALYEAKRAGRNRWQLHGAAPQAAEASPHTPA